MKKFLTLSTIALVALSMGIGAKAASSTPQINRLERQVAWDQRHIHQLQQRRAYLHRYIRHLRAPSPYAASVPASGPLYISKAQAAAAMSAAGFSESVIEWFNGGIIARESGYCPTAVYPSHCGDVSLFVRGGPACSLFQLFHCPGPQVADPYVAARYAYVKFQHQGYSAWGGR